MENSFKDFTDEIYSNIVNKASQKWPFISFKHAKKNGKACLWRHDIDFSLNRALKLAEIEIGTFHEEILQTFPEEMLKISQNI